MDGEDEAEGTTARQGRLATELRRLREATGLSSREAAALLGVSAAQISQIEAGLTGVSGKRLRRLAANYTCSDDDLIDALVAMAADRAQGWWEEYRGVLPSAYLDLAELDHYATFRHDVAVTHVPGLFQTEDYARALFAYMNPEFPAGEVDLRVAHRMKRKVVIEGASPIPYETVIHEAALRIKVAGRTAFRTQLARIVELSEADHVTVRVIRDAPHGTVFLDSKAQLEHFRTLFRTVRKAALPPERSRDLIHRLTKEM
ncbi:helix-turn-helix domain-containing protein [Streptomyces sp. MMBL 11-3]|uniref:helix-turn-helix domain-containing protein n=1 Tax=Streptomyces sp. MMBL 11-3 TaxID=3382639 RepID=UPI0039B4A19C